MLSKRIVLTMGVAVLGFSLVGCNKSNQSSTIGSAETASVSPTSGISDANIIFQMGGTEIAPTTMQEAIAKVHNSVVTIDATLSKGTGSGAGVLVAHNETDSYIMTCHHVIEGAYSLKVTLNDGTQYDALLVGGDPQTDIAVITIPVVGLTYSSLIEDSSTVALGSSVFAIGNPLGTLGGSVTSGIISATSRDITTSDGTVMTLMQTDAAINSGNSGGGLFNTNGELIGIVNAKYSASGIEGLGFAIPMNTAIDITSQLITKGYVEGRYNLGLTIQSNGFYVYVAAVDETGCAYSLLKTYDILTGITITYQDGSESKSMNIGFQTSASAVVSFLSNLNVKIGDTISFSIQRDRYNSSATQIVNVEITQYVYTMPTK